MSQGERAHYFARVHSHCAYVAHHGKGKPRRSHARCARWALRERAEALAAMWPPHHELWTCLNRYEAKNDWDNRDGGHNGHYGGLQMHPGWGHGTSYYASDDSRLVQERAAEHAYRQSGYSHSFLTQQWGQTIGPCWQFA